MIKDDQEKGRSIEEAYDYVFAVLKPHATASPTKGLSENQRGKRSRQPNDDDFDLCSSAAKRQLLQTDTPRKSLRNREQGRSSSAFPTGIEGSSRAIPIDVSSDSENASDDEASEHDAQYTASLLRSPTASANSHSPRRSLSPSTPSGAHISERYASTLPRPSTPWRTWTASVRGSDSRTEMPSPPTLRQVESPSKLNASWATQHLALGMTPRSSGTRAHGE